MRRLRLVWQIYIPFLLIAGASVLALAGYASHSFRSFHMERSAADLEARGLLVEDALKPLLRGGDAAAALAETRRLGARMSDLVENSLGALLPGGSAGKDRKGGSSPDSMRPPRVGPELTPLQARVRGLAQRAGIRVTVIDSSGLVLADSHKNPALMDNHAGRPEIALALDGATGRAVRFSKTLEQNMIYVAVPVVDDGAVIAVVRSSLPLTDIEKAAGRLVTRVAGGALAVAALLALASLLISRRVSRPLEDLREAADRFAHGEFAVRVDPSGSEEVAALALSMNRMAAELDERIRALAQERNEREAVLSSMVEGVVAIGAEHEIIALNDSGAKLLGVQREGSGGRSIQEITRSPELQAFVDEVLSGGRPAEREISLHEGERRYFHVQGSPVRDGEGRRIGAVVVFHDVTRLKRLERVRRDFVANVSHELKTPTTSIKGFLETLEAGALEDREKAREFVAIAARQADRLSAIIDDLLTLSMLEEDADERRLETEAVAVADLLRDAVEICRFAASEKKVELRLRCAEGLEANINAALIEQAVVNLLDNAVKYSAGGGEVEIVAELDCEGGLVIEVRDHGCGIEEKHLPRLFERFYRVDRARSRKLGGTGLGLAIVKHISQAHGGTVAVRSRPGEGSTFSLRLPAAS